MLKSHQFGVAMQVTKGGDLFIGEVLTMQYCCIVKLYCKSYCKRFYWIPLFTILLLFYVFEVGKAKSATQSVLMVLTLNGLFQKNSKVFYFTPENPISHICLFFSIIVFVL